MEKSNDLEVQKFMNSVIEIARLDDLILDFEKKMVKFHNISEKYGLTDTKEYIIVMKLSSSIRNLMSLIVLKHKDVTQKLRLTLSSKLIELHQQLIVLKLKSETFPQNKELVDSLTSILTDITAIYPLYIMGVSI